MLAILFADCGRQDIDHPGVVFLGLHPGEQLLPQRFVFEDIFQDFADADKEIGEGQCPIRFLREPDNHDALTERFIRSDGIFDTREQVGFADSARPDKQKMVFRFSAH